MIVAGTHELKWFPPPDRRDQQRERAKTTRNATSPRSFRPTRTVFQSSQSYSWHRNRCYLPPSLKRLLFRFPDPKLRACVQLQALHLPFQQRQGHSRKCSLEPMRYSRHMNAPTRPQSHRCQLRILDRWNDWPAEKMTNHFPPSLHSCWYWLAHANTGTARPSPWHCSTQQLPQQQQRCPRSRLRHLRLLIYQSTRRAQSRRNVRSQRQISALPRQLLGSTAYMYLEVAAAVWERRRLPPQMSNAKRPQKCRSRARKAQSTKLPSYCRLF